MKTIKIIDLLNKIANGEEVPKKIKYNGTIYEKFDYNNKYYDVENDTIRTDILSEHLASESFYNDEVEILEEEKEIPEKLSTWFSVENVQNNGVDKTEFIIKYANHNFETYFNKINEIIDYLKSKGDE